MLVRCMRSSSEGGRFLSSLSIADSLIPSYAGTEVATRPANEVSTQKAKEYIGPVTRFRFPFGGGLFRQRDVHSVDFATVIAKRKEVGQVLSKDQVIDAIRGLTNHKRYKKALELCDAVLEQRVFKPSEFDYAFHLRLVFFVHGLDSAQMFFENLPETMKGKITHTALLRLFIWEEETSKAETVLEKMSESGFLNSPHPYIHMMSLYFSKGHFKKSEEMFKHVKKGITGNDRKRNCVYYSMWIGACANQNNVEGAEKVLAEMDAAWFQPTWQSWAKLGGMYIRMNLLEKASDALKKIEEAGSENPKAYYSMMTMHASMGNKDGVFRIWELMKSNVPGRNDYGHGVMLKSLLTLDLYLEAKEFLNEWGSCFSPHKKPFIFHHMRDRLIKYPRSRSKSVKKRNRIMVLGIRG